MPSQVDQDFIDGLSAQSTLADVPSYDMTLDLSLKGEVLGETFDRRPELPGVVVTDGSRVLGVISRGQYLRAIGRQFGREVFHPRPLQLLWDSVESMEEPLVLATATPIQKAVAAALDRPRALIYEPVIVEILDAAGEARPRLVDFPDLLRADSRISALRNQQMKQILTTVQEGFLLVDRELEIAGEYSDSIETIFGREDLAGRRLPEVLAEVLDDEKAELASDYLGTLFNPNVIEKLVTQINPLRRVETKRGGRPQHLAFRFLRGLDDDGSIRRVLVRIEDVTREVALAAELAAQEKKAEERVDLVFEIVGTESEALASFLETFAAGLAEAEALLAEDDLPDARPIGDRLDALFRRMHALKGEAGLLRLATFQARVHRYEDTIARLRRRVESGTSPEQTRAGITSDEIAGDEITSELRRGLGDLETLLEQNRSVIDQFRRLAEVGSGVGAENPAADAVPGLFDRVSRLVEDLSARLGKPARFLARNDESEVPEPYRGLLREALVQLARNSMVHGIEAPETRRERGKPERGTLQFAVKRHPQAGQLELIFQDDGGGLDLDAIRRRAAERGLAVDGDGEVAKLIFRSGFSTAERTTIDAGRGVGMDVVLERVRELGGTIVPHTRPGVFCAFQILLPLHS